MTAETKDELKKALVMGISSASEVRKIVVFGSFLDSDNPEDMDVAVFQDSSESYLPLATKYRRMTKAIARRIPLDIIPLRFDADGLFLKEIAKGEVVYER